MNAPIAKITVSQKNLGPMNAAIRIAGIHGDKMEATFDCGAVISGKNVAEIIKKYNSKTTEKIKFVAYV